MSDTTDFPDFKTLQYTFAAHLRDPQHNPPPPDIEPRRLAVYRELLINNVEGLLAGTYPVIRRILPKELWQKLIQDFFATHHSRTPLFPQMPQEFLHYLETRKEEIQNLPFLRELAHYEWIELALTIDSRELDFKGVNRNGDLLQEQPVLSPLALPLVYRFPVHLLSPSYQPTEPPEQPTYIIIYRNTQDKVQFVQLNPLSARLFQTLLETKMKGQTVLEKMAEELAHPKPEIIIAGGLQILQEWLKRDIILGTVVPHEDEPPSTK